MTGSSSRCGARGPCGLDLVCLGISTIGPDGAGSAETSRSARERSWRSAATTRGRTGAARRAAGDAGCPAMPALQRAPRTVTHHKRRLPICFEAWELAAFSVSETAKVASLIPSGRQGRPPPRPSGKVVVFAGSGGNAYRADRRFASRSVGRENHGIRMWQVKGVAEAVWEVKKTVRAKPLQIGEMQGAEGRIELTTP